MTGPPTAVTVTKNGSSAGGAKSSAPGAARVTWICQVPSRSPLSGSSRRKYTQVAPDDEKTPGVARVKVLPAGLMTLKRRFSELDFQLKTTVIEIGRAHV